jgi:hypothetical protein
MILNTHIHASRSPRVRQCSTIVLNLDRSSKGNSHSQPLVTLLDRASFRPTSFENNSLLLLRLGFSTGYEDLYGVSWAAWS